MLPPTRGALVAVDPALIVAPPRGLEAGYVPIVTHQAAKIPDLSEIVTPEMLTGRYQHEPVENGWHIGELQLEGSKSALGFRWTNKAGVSWKLTADLVHARLECDRDSPYFSQESGKSFRIEMQAAAGSGKPTVGGFQFNGAFYKRLGDQ